MGLGHESRIFVTDHALLAGGTLTRRGRRSRILHSQSTRPSRPRPQPARAVAETAASLPLRAAAAVASRQPPLVRDARQGGGDEAHVGLAGAGDLEDLAVADAGDDWGRFVADAVC